MSYHSYQVATDGDPTSTSNLIPEGPPKVTYNDQPGALSLNADGTTTVNKPRGFNTADAVPMGATGILASARTPWGSQCTGGITEKDIITIDGMQVSVGTAEMMGMVHKDVSGRYVESAGGVEQAKADADADNQRQESEDPVEGFEDPAGDTAMNEMCKAVSPGLQVSALHEIISNGAVDATTLNRAASEAGIEPGEMQQRVDGVMKHFEAQAMKAIVSYGSDDPGGFIEWAKQHRPNDLKEAGRKQGMDRSTKGYEPMVREYLASMAEHDPESVMKAQSSTGVTVTKVKGQVLVNIPGKMPMTFRTALKEGLIRVSGA